MNEIATMTYSEAIATQRAKQLDHLIGRVLLRGYGSKLQREILAEYEVQGDTAGYETLSAAFRAAIVKAKEIKTGIIIACHNHKYYLLRANNTLEWHWTNNPSINFTMEYKKFHKAVVGAVSRSGTVCVPRKRFLRKR